MKNILYKTTLALGLSLICLSSIAEQVVIVHSSNNSALTEKGIVRLYLAKEKVFPNGELAIPINHKDSSDARKDFDRKVIDKGPAQMKSYWAQLVFTGKATPPKQVDNDDEVLELVSKNPGAIGYLDSAKVNDSVRVVHKF